MREDSRREKKSIFDSCVDGICAAAYQLGYAKGFVKNSLSHITHSEKNDNKQPTENNSNNEVDTFVDDRAQITDELIKIPNDLADKLKSLNIALMSEDDLTMTQLIKKLYNVPKPLYALRELVKESLKVEKELIKIKAELPNLQEQLSKLLTAIGLDASIIPPELKDDYITNLAQGPSPFEQFLTKELIDAGVLEISSETPDVRILLLSRNKMAFVSFRDSGVSFKEKMRVLRIEAALNRAMRVEKIMQQSTSEYNNTLSDMYRAAQDSDKHVLDILQSVNASSNLSGEWDTRQAIASLIESIRTPYRTDCDFRVNAASGIVAINISGTQPHLFPRTTYMASKNELIRTTKVDRDTLASIYNLEEVILLSSAIAKIAPQTKEIWVNVFDNRKTKTICKLSAKINTRDLDNEHVDAIKKIILENNNNAELLSSLVDAFDKSSTSINIVNNVLQNTSVLFSFESEELSPKWRFEDPANSYKLLSSDVKKKLGIENVDELKINNFAERAKLAEEMSRKLTGNVSNDIDVILGIKDKTTDASSIQAAENVAKKIKSGAINSHDINEIIENFESDDDGIKETIQELQSCTEENEQDVIKKLDEMIGFVDVFEKYHDGERIAHRSFASYAERIIYNKLFTDEGKKVELDPLSYLDAHMILGEYYQAHGDMFLALKHYMRAAELNPVSSEIKYNIALAYSSMGDTPMAIATATEALKYAFDKDSIASIYDFLGDALWKSGDTKCASVCFRIPITMQNQIASSCSTKLILLEAQGLYEQIPSEEIPSILAKKGIPLAPTETIKNILLNATIASVDSELFCVANDLAKVVADLSHDDIIYDISKSLDTIPDK